MTITQNKAKSKKSFGVKGLSLWLSFQALNHINNRKQMILESVKINK